MTLPLRKLGDRLRSCLKLVLLAMVELCDWRPLCAKACMQTSDSAGTEIVPPQQPASAHGGQPVMSAAIAENNHGTRQHTQAFRELRYPLLAHCRNGPNARQPAAEACNIAQPPIAADSPFSVLPASNAFSAPWRARNRSDLRATDRLRGPRCQPTHLCTGEASAPV